jgi:ribosome-associated protein
MADTSGPRTGTGTDTEEDLGPSKSAVKRAMTALQDMGGQLVQLSDRELARMPIEDETLARAISEARRIRSNSALRRQMQYIGKLMRKIDAEPIARALTELHQKKHQQTDAFHQLEALRDTLLEQGPDGIEDAMQLHPGADRQHLRQLLRQHQKEVSQNKPPAAARKLFKYLCELSD